MSIEITWMLIWSNTNTRHVLVKQLKVKKKERIKSRIIITIISFSRKVYKITTFFYIDPDWIEDNFMTSESDFFKI